MDAQAAAATNESQNWLSQLVGEWESEMKADMGPDKPTETHRGMESVRMLGHWMLAEGRGDMGGIEHRMLMTLGYDAGRGLFTGTWIGSMMDHMWIYQGRLDEARKVLTLDTEGPDMSGMMDCKPGEPMPANLPMAKYQDIIELVTPDHRKLRSRMQDKDGNWHQFMEADYHRVKP